MIALQRPYCTLMLGMTPAESQCAGAGLDARAANIVMRVVRNVADTGRTIVCTIHQPAIDIFEVSPTDASECGAAAICLQRNLCTAHRFLRYLERTADK